MSKNCELSNINVDMSSSNFICHLCQLDVYTRSSIFFKIGHVKLVYFGVVANEVEFCIDFHPFG